ncbi:homoserine dehydrogenase [Alicyclobacillus cellulosilyticus]|uniref:Homoserine dehydrogenase n=1 Tax=Alicyclobacillus cellulosilyticus TaxID=1003997 RepID=A0A917NFI6_9BACL|nr:homoserine dehydrogenase [Alicyclobacillus cellulosilyticus]GGI97959.1 homoserine dehydrogenase [Alicyclobacillus cellulosilyticus]
MDVCLGLLGCGTVGSGVIELTRRRREKIFELTGLRPKITKVLVRNLQKPRQVALADERLTADPEDILGDADIRVVIETIGGIEPARTLILRALAAGKHVVTANKDLIAAHGPEILEAAERHGVDVWYEAAVGGAIPLIRPLKECLTANEITDIKGIINGTTNYILSKMTATGAGFAEALAEAQALGYAEADPSSDVDGLDAARKLAILASIAFHAKVRLEDIRVTGIRHITAADVAYADELGMVIKLLAVGADRDGLLSLRVGPALVPKDHPLAHVNGSYNALLMRGDAAGDLMFFGRGAGSMPTASAVVGDVIEVLRNLKLGVTGQAALLCRPDKRVLPDGFDPVRYYMRLSVDDRPGVLARIAAAFGDAEVSMESVLQKRAYEGRAEIVILTHEVPYGQVERVAAALRSLAAVHEVHCVMPVEPAADGGVT